MIASPPRTGARCSWTAEAASGGTPCRQTGCVNTPSRNDIGSELILDGDYSVLQAEFSLLEPLDLQLIPGHHPLQRLDGHVEVAMLLLQPSKIGLEITRVVVGKIQGSWPRACSRRAGSKTRLSMLSAAPVGKLVRQLSKAGLSHCTIVLPSTCHSGYGTIVCRAINSGASPRCRLRII